MRRVASCCCLAALFALAAVGCPPHELRIEISPGGAQAITGSCRLPKQECVDGTGEACCNTAVPLNTVLDGDAFGFQILLLDRRDGAAVLGARSACLRLELNCFDLEPETAEAQCFADAMNRAMNEGMSELSFDGMDPEHVDVAVSVHTGLGSEQGCDAEEVFACALLIKPSEAETYDIVCADCTGNAPSVNLGGGSFNIAGTLCGSECFVVDCHRLLRGERL